MTIQERIKKNRAMDARIAMRQTGDSIGAKYRLVLSPLPGESPLDTIRRQLCAERISGNGNGIYVTTQDDFLAWATPEYEAALKMPYAERKCMKAVQDEQPFPTSLPSVLVFTRYRRCGTRYIPRNG
jgi:hypothetical protein